MWAGLYRVRQQGRAKIDHYYNLVGRWREHLLLRTPLIHLHHAAVVSHMHNLDKPRLSDNQDPFLILFVSVLLPSFPFPLIQLGISCTRGSRFNPLELLINSIFVKRGRRWNRWGNKRGKKGKKKTEGEILRFDR